MNAVFEAVAVLAWCLGLGALLRELPWAGSPEALLGGGEELKSFLSRSTIS